MFRIVTDTSANLPTDYLLSEQITIIPYTFQSGKGEQSCMDLTTFDAKDFYAQMRSGVKVTTSQIPPQRYIDVLTPMLEAGEDVLFVSMSSGISGSYASGQIAARQLREEFPDRKLLLVDTYSASLGEGLLVMRAADCRRFSCLCQTLLAIPPEDARYRGRAEAIFAELCRLRWRVLSDPRARMKNRGAAALTLLGERGFRRCAAARG